MSLLRNEIENNFKTWLKAWNNHDLEGVMKWMHDEIEFKNWNGTTINGKNELNDFWAPWFLHHGNFKFIPEDFFIDEHQQKMTFSWKLEWPSFERAYFGKKELRQGVDILHLKKGKIFKKNTYSKTFVHINEVEVRMGIL